MGKKERTMSFVGFRGLLYDRIKQRDLMFGQALQHSNQSFIETTGISRKACISTMKTSKQNFVKALMSSALCLHHDRQSLRVLSIMVPPTLTK